MACIFILLGLGAFVFAFLLFISAPYGRHRRGGWDPQINGRAGWILMEFPAVAVFAFLFFAGINSKSPAAVVFLALWEFHYLYRAFLFPALMRGSSVMPVVIVLMGILFNVLNAYINARSLFTFSGGYPASWLLDPRFLVGSIIFLAGFSIHFTSDRILRNLRKPGETGYKIPAGGLFRFISCPNYFGELIQWLGWAVATWSLAGLVFFLWTFANLFPRALSHHRWYKARFPDFPRARRAIIPFIL